MPTLYYQIKFVTLHQKNPGYDVNSPPKLTIGSVETGAYRYWLEAGFGDPGESPSFDNFDYAEFQISRATFTPPADYSVRDTYVVEALGGGSRTVSYQTWRSVQVSDGFAIPGELAGPSLPSDSFIAANWQQTGSPAGYHSQADYTLGHNQIVDQGITFTHTPEFGPGIPSFFASLGANYFTKSLTGAVDRLVEKYAVFNGLASTWTAMKNADAVWTAASKSVEAQMDAFGNMINLFGRGEVDAHYTGQQFDQLAALALTNYGKALNSTTGTNNPVLTSFLSSVNTVATVYPKQNPYDVNQKFQLFLDVSTDSSIVAAPGGLGTPQIFAVGGFQANTIAGERLGDVIHGGGGNDIINGGGGDDYLNGGDGDDTIHSQSAGQDSALIRGGTGRDTIYVGSWDALAFGDEGDDTFHIQASNKSSNIVGGEGFDTVILPLARSQYVVDPGTQPGPVVNPWPVPPTVTASDGSRLLFHDIERIVDVNGATVWTSADAAKPRLSVSGNGTTISDGDVSPSYADYTDFGFTTVGNTLTRTYSVTNLGGSALSLSNLKLPTGFTLIDGLSATLNPGQTDTLTVKVDTSKVAAYTGSVSFSTNDASTSVFDFAIKAAVTSYLPQAVIGDDANNSFEATSKAEQFSGYGGDDTVTYASANAGVAASLFAAARNKGDAAGDSYSSIENLVGSRFADVLTGDANDNVLEGGGGADRLIGGDGIDTASYANATGGVRADLTKPKTNAGDAEGDTFKFIENLTGSDHADILVGNKMANTLSGGNGDDLLSGGGGRDFLFGGAGADTFHFASAKQGDVKIGDFSVGEDQISISRAGFKLGSGVGVGTNDAYDFASHYFVSSPQGLATEIGHGQFVFNEVTDQLFWDADGAGSKAATLLAEFTQIGNVSANDFILV